MSNTIAFHGRLTKDAEVQATTTGKTLCKFTVASDVGFGDHKSTNFFDVVIFGKRAEGQLPQYLKKATQVFISGELKIEKRDYEGKTYTNVTVLNPNAVDLVGGRSGSSEGGRSHEENNRSQNGYNNTQGGNDDDDSDIPF